MNNSFYFIKQAAKKGEVYFKPVVAYDQKKMKTREFVPEVPMPVVIDRGIHFYDVVTFSDPFNFAISRKFRDILIEHNFSGWDSFPVKIEGLDEKYYGFQVTGKCGPVDRTGGPGWITGYRFDINTWDGSDFFCPEGTLLIFITEKVKAVLKKNKLSNLVIENIQDFKWYTT